VRTSVKPRSPACMAHTPRTYSQKPCQGSGSWMADSMSAAYSAIGFAKVAAMSCSRLGKRRNRVATPTSACRATSFIEASRPCSAKTSRAASIMRSRLRLASARRGAVASGFGVS